MNRKLSNNICAMAVLSLLTTYTVADPIYHKLTVKAGESTMVPLTDPDTGEEVLHPDTGEVIMVPGPFSGSSFDMGTAPTPLQPGVEGGFVLGTFQNYVLDPDEPHPQGWQGDIDGDGIPDGSAGTGFGATPVQEGTVILPFNFFGTATYLGTNPLSYQSGNTKAPVTAEVDMDSCVDNVCNMTAIMESWEVMWNGSAFEQGPRDGGPFVPAEGTYNLVTHEYMLDWNSRIVGGPFSNVLGHWHFEGIHGVDAIASDDGEVEPAAMADIITTDEDLVAAGFITADEAMEVSCNPNCFDIVAPTNADGVATVVIPLPTPVVADSIFRVYAGSAWHTLDESAGDSVGSATDNSGMCPPPGSVNYTSPVTEGDNCIQLRVTDNGANDEDSVELQITILGGFAQGVVADDQVNPGATISSDSGSLNLWLLFSVFASLGLLRIRRRTQ